MLRRRSCASRFAFACQEHSGRLDRECGNARGALVRAPPSATGVYLHRITALRLGSQSGPCDEAEEPAAVRRGQLAGLVVEPKNLVGRHAVLDWKHIEISGPIVREREHPRELDLELTSHPWRRAAAGCWPQRFEAA